MSHCQMSGEAKLSPAENPWVRPVSSPWGARRSVHSTTAELTMPDSGHVLYYPKSSTQTCQPSPQSYSQPSSSSSAALDHPARTTDTGTTGRRRVRSRTEKKGSAWHKHHQGKERVEAQRRRKTWQDRREWSAWIRGTCGRGRGRDPPGSSGGPGLEPRAPGAPCASPSLTRRPRKQPARPRHLAGQRCS